MFCAGAGTGTGAGAGGSMLLERWTLCFSSGVNSSSTSRAPMDTAAVYKRLVRVGAVLFVPIFMLKGPRFRHCHVALLVLPTQQQLLQHAHSGQLSRVAPLRCSALLLYCSSRCIFYLMHCCCNALHSAAMLGGAVSLLQRRLNSSTQSWC
jgi:hypothetical protein